MGLGAIVLSLGICLGAFFVVAFLGKISKENGGPKSRPMVHALALAVFCSGWFFYGLVDMAATSGMMFLALSLGPTLTTFVWWFIFRRMIRISKENNISSIADFIAFRFGNSTRVGAIIAVLSFMAFIPLIAYEISTVDRGFDILNASNPGSEGLKAFDIALVFSVLTGIFAGFFGTGKKATSQDGRSLIWVLAADGIFKIAVFVAVGFYVVWIKEFFTSSFVSAAQNVRLENLLHFDRGGDAVYSPWMTLLLVSATSLFVAPNIFHVLVLENEDERAVATSMWVFPAYLFVINLFVLPLALYGLIDLPATQPVEFATLFLPLSFGNAPLALLVYVAGFGASFCMVTVSAVTLSTMLQNNLFMPILLKFKWLGTMTEMLLQTKRLVIMVTILLAYGFLRNCCDYNSMLNAYVISLAGIVQLAPAFFGGLFWRQATKKGVIVGLSLGLITWGFTMFLPMLCDSGLVSNSVMTNGLFGFELLKPTAFLGLNGLDPISHGVFWSVLFNLSGFVIVSLFTTATKTELEHIARIIYSEHGKPGGFTSYRLSLEPTVGEFEDVLINFHGLKRGRHKLRAFFGGNYNRGDKVGQKKLDMLIPYLETQIAEVIGASASRAFMESFISGKGGRQWENTSQNEVSLSLEQSREELENRVRELYLLFESAKCMAGSLNEDEVVTKLQNLLERDFSINYQGFFYISDDFVKAGPYTGLNLGFLRYLNDNPKAPSLIREAKQSLETKRGGKTGSVRYVEFMAENAVNSALVVPVKSDNRVFAVMLIASRDKDWRISPQFVKMLEALANELALAISNARLFNEVNDLNKSLEEKVEARTKELQQAIWELAEVDRLKSQFLTNMSHELRTPLNAIMGYSQLIADGVDGPVTPDQLNSLNRVEQNARHLLKIIEDLLEMSKIQAGKMELERVPVNICELVKEVFEDLKSLAIIKGLEAVFEANQNIPMVSVDLERMRDVMYNLIGNALKFTSEGSVRVEISSEDGEFVKISVTDTGPGISGDNLKIIFDAFKQVDASSTRSFGGVGLGLNIAKSIVEMHGGKILVESQPGRGSAFSVLLPAHAADN